MYPSLILESTIEELIETCFIQIKTVYLNIKNDLESDKKLSISESWLFLYKKSLNKENDIRDLIFMKLHNFWFLKYEKEKDKKDLTYQTDLKEWFTFIIEAKRLNWNADLNNEYIKNWVNRFKNKDWVTDYSVDIKKNDNVAWMLWFVIENWKTWKIIDNLQEKIIKNDTDDKIFAWKYILEKEDSFISENWYFEKNKRNWKNFTLYHHFLDFSDS